MTTAISPRESVLSSDKPPEHNFNVEGIAQGLISLPRWVCWDWKKISGTWSKIPKQPQNTLRNASSTDTETWCDFATAVSSAENNGIGLGFVFNGDGVVGIDLDDCRDPDTGKLSGWAADILDKIKTYTEISPSGTGLKLFVRGKLPEDSRRQFKRPDDEPGKIEVYADGRFFTVTGKREFGTPDDIREQQAGIDALMTMVSGWSTKPQVKQHANQERTFEQPLTIDRERRITRALAYLNTIPPAVSGQGGSTATLIAAKKVLAFGLSREDAFDVLTGWNLTCVPPWSDAELWHKIDDAIKSGVTPMEDREETPRMECPMVDPIDGSRAEESKSAQSTETDILRPIAAGELIRSFPNLRPAVIEGLIRKGETVNIVAAPKMGKSWLSMAIALDVATGGKVFGRFWSTPGKVLIVDNELHSETSAHRLPHVAEAKGLRLEQYADRLFVVNLRGRLLDMNHLRLELLKLKRGEFSLIILDAWYRFLPEGKDENSNADVTGLYNILDSTAGVLDCAFACIHHTSKGNQSSKSVTDAGSGAGSQSRAADCHLIMRQHEEENAIVVEAAVRSFAPVDPFCLRWSFPVFELAEDLDPSNLKQDRPRRGSKQHATGGISREEQQQHEDHEKRKRVMEAYMMFPDGETMRVIREATGLNTNSFKVVNSELIRAGVVSPCKVIKNKRSENGFKADQNVFLTRWDAVGQLMEIPPSPTSPTDAESVGGTTAPPLGAVSQSHRREGGTASTVRVLQDAEVDRIGNLFGGQAI